MGGDGLEGRRVVLCVSGGIAAYKAVEICRRLMDAGAHVAPVLSEGALRFVGRNTFDALASQPATVSLFDDRDPIPHTRLGQSADVVVVAPATASVLGRYAAGISDEIVTATLLATRAPVLVAPAMHTEMWEHPATRRNIEILADRGVTIVPPGQGRLAGGDEGVGRLAEPEEVVAAVAAVLGPRDLDGLRVLVTAGGTRERLDAVRYLGNRSSGKQGHAVAVEAARRGASVVLVTTSDRPAPGVAEVVRVESAAEMADAVTARRDNSDVIVMAAAVADFRPADPSSAKLKKSAGPPRVVLEPTVDILAELGTAKAAGQTLVGFAAETDAIVENATDKLARKRLDLMVANDVSAPGVGFGHDTNAVMLLGADGFRQDVPLSDKRAVAAAILNAVVAQRAGAHTAPPHESSAQEHS